MVFYGNKKRNTTKTQKQKSSQKENYENEQQVNTMLKEPPPTNKIKQNYANNILIEQKSNGNIKNGSESSESDGECTINEYSSSGEEVEKPTRNQSRITTNKLIRDVSMPSSAGSKYDKNNPKLKEAYVNFCKKMVLWMTRQILRRK